MSLCSEGLPHSSSAFSCLGWMLYLIVEAHGFDPGFSSLDNET